MKILALDLGNFKTLCCFFDTKTRKHEFLTAATERSYLTTVFKKHKVDLVVMEACGPSGWIHDLAVKRRMRKGRHVDEATPLLRHVLIRTTNPRSNEALSC